MGQLEIRFSRPYCKYTYDFFYHTRKRAFKICRNFSELTHLGFLAHQDEVFTKLA